MENSLIYMSMCKHGRLLLSEIQYPEIGICGLSCRLCPEYQKKVKTKCGGCKSSYRMRVGCPFITCAVKEKGVEFCWDCEESSSCEKWKNHRDFSLEHDTFVCYQRLNENILLIQEIGVQEFEKLEKTRENVLKDFLQEFNEGRSKRYYCVAATVLEIKELQQALDLARSKSQGRDIKEKSKLLHEILDEIAAKQGYNLKIRK